MMNTTTVSASTHPHLEAYEPSVHFSAVQTQPANDSAIVLGNLKVDVEGFRAEVDDEPVTLTTQEFELLAALARRAGRLVTQEALAVALWPEPKVGYGRHIGVVMSRIRAKLSAAYPYRIETVRNRGFVLKSARV
jgi:DNA-binding response OmpR family regulator